MISSAWLISPSEGNRSESRVINSHGEMMLKLMASRAHMCLTHVKSSDDNNKMAYNIIGLLTAEVAYIRRHYRRGIEAAEAKNVEKPIAMQEIKATKRTAATSKCPLGDLRFHHCYGNNEAVSL